MTDITIPPEAVEAGAIAICKYSHYEWDRVSVLHEIFRGEARACFQAMVKAWPNRYETHWVDGTTALILPLPPQENENG